MWWNKPLDVEEPELIPVKGAGMEQLVAAMCVASKVEIEPQTPDVMDLTQFGTQEPPGQEVGTLKFVVEWDPVLKEGRFGKSYFKGRDDTTLQSRKIPGRFSRML